MCSIVGFKVKPQRKCAKVPLFWKSYLEHIQSQLRFGKMSIISDWNVTRIALDMDYFEKGKQVPKKGI
jgi:hypothetical protein